MRLTGSLGAREGRNASSRCGRRTEEEDRGWTRGGLLPTYKLYALNEIYG